MIKTSTPYDSMCDSLLEHLVRPHPIRLADLALFQMIDEPRFRPRNLVLRRLKFTLEAVTRSPHSHWAG